MAYTSGSIPNANASGEEFPLFGADTTAPAQYGAYGILLSRLKDFLCGNITKPVPGIGNVGEGTIHSFDMVDPDNAVDDTWTLLFSAPDTFDITGATYGLVGTFVLVPPVEGDIDTVVAVIPGATLTVTQAGTGFTAFASGDSFTFDTVRSALLTQGYSVIADTARGVGSTINTALEVLAYVRDITGNRAVFESFGKYGTDDQADAGYFPINVTKLVYYDQESLRKTLYLDFYSSTHYKLKDSAGVIITTGAVGEFLDYRSPTFSIGITVEHTGAQPVYTHADASSNGIPPLVKYPSALFAPATARTVLKITPPLNEVSGDTRVTRAVTLKSRGLTGADTIYYTLVQRVGGLGDGNRWYLDCQCHRTYNPLDTVLEQVNISPAARVINHQGAVADYNLIADGRCFKLLTKLTSNDYQVLMGGFFLPHSTPGSYPWPGFVAGTIGNGNFEAVAGSFPTVTDHAPGYNPGVVGLSPTVNGYDKSSTLWVCLPTGQWIHGANHSAGNLNANPTAKVLSEAASGFDAVYTSPWIHRTGGSDGTTRRACKISCNAYGDPSVKTMFPGMIMLGTGVINGILGEFPGVFFVGQSDSSPADRGDTINNGGTPHLVWAGTTVQPANAAVLAAFAQE